MVLETDPELGVLDGRLSFDCGCDPGCIRDPRPVFLGLLDKVGMWRGIDVEQRGFFAITRRFAAGDEERKRHEAEYEELVE